MVLQYSIKIKDGMGSLEDGWWPEARVIHMKEPHHQRGETVRRNECMPELVRVCSATDPHQPPDTGTHSH